MLISEKNTLNLKRLIYYLCDSSKLDKKCIMNALQIEQIVDPYVHITIIA